MPRETEEELYHRLHAKYGGGSKRRRTEPPPQPDEDDDADHGIIYLVGRQADDFLDRMFGTDRQEYDDEDQDDDDEDQDDDAEPDPGPAQTGPRFFRTRPRRT